MERKVIDLQKTLFIVDFYFGLCVVDVSIFFRRNVRDTINLKKVGKKKVVLILTVFIPTLPIFYVSTLLKVSI